MKYILLKIILFIWTTNTFTQVTYFNRQYFDPETTWGSAKSIIVKEDSYVVSGIGGGYNGTYNKNLIFVTLDKEGNSSNWAHFGEPNKHYYPAGYGTLIQTSDGYVMPVVTEQGDCLSSYLFKFNNSFSPDWYQGAYANYLNQDTCKTVFHGIVEVESGGFVMTGEQLHSPSELSDIHILKTDSLGNEQWQNMIGSSWYELPTSIIQTSDSGFLIGAYKENPNIYYSGNALVVRTDKSGNEIWSKEFGGEFKDCGACVTRTFDNNYIVGFGHAYYENIPGLSYTRLSFIKIDDFGDTIWHRKFGGIHLGNCVNEIIQTNDSNYVAVGSTTSDPNTYILGWLFKFTDSGDSIWYREYEANVGQYQQWLYDVELTQDNGYVMCGQSLWNEPPLPPVPQKMWVVKVDSIGCDFPNCDSTIEIKEHKLNSTISTLISPNPFTTSTTLSFRLSKPENVHFTVYNVQSQIVYTMQEKQQKGEQQVRWNAEGMPAGVYYFRLQAGEMLGSGKMVKVE